MKSILLFVFIFLPYFNYAMPADTVGTVEENNVICEIGLSALKITGQVTGGLLGGFTGAALIHFNPFTSGMGWVLGSSAAVYLIGNISGGKGSFWLTASSGAAPLLFFIIPLDQAGDAFSAMGLVLSAVLVSLTTEIAGYYITKPFVKQNNKISAECFNNNFSLTEIKNNSRLKCPVDISVEVLRLNF